METATPGQTKTLIASGLPSGESVGYQIINAATGLVVSARSTASIVERPAGAGSYYVPYTAPVEGDLYLIVLDWSAGVLTPETTKIFELQVSMTPDQADTGLGQVADYAKTHLGGETWKLLIDSPNYGANYVSTAIAVVKDRIMESPPTTVDEGTLHRLVLDYLGLSVALELISAARDAWGSQLISESTGDDPVEITTYTNRASMMSDLRDDLMRQYAQAQALAIPLLDAPRLGSSVSGPEIDEDDTMHFATSDPRRFPSADEFPFHHHATRPLELVNPS